MNTRIARKVLGRALTENLQLAARQLSDSIVAQLGCQDKGYESTGAAEKVRSLISCLDFLESLLASGLYQFTVPVERVLSQEERGLLIVRRKLQEVLGLFGVHAMELDGKHVDYGLHDVARVIPTQDPSEDGDIAEVVASGYRTDTKVLRRMLVVVRKYEQTPATQSPGI